MSSKPDSLVLPGSPGSASAVRILVADDGKNAADILGLFLKMEGYDVHVVYDGDQAITAAGEYDPHVILMDISMPGTDGVEAARKIRESHPDGGPAVVALTGYDGEDTKRMCEEAGIRRCVSKPVSPADLWILLKEVVAELLSAEPGEAPRPMTRGALPN